jgi:GNAT superfamily N-acetyltransferase
MSLRIRSIELRDEARWRELWEGYCRFYERELSDAVTRQTWCRIVNPTSGVHAIVAEREGAGVIGIANYVIHESTSATTPVCYLQDLFVDPIHRGGSVGKQLIDWLRAEMVKRKWSRLYWHTKETNYGARALYDKYTPHSGFLRYVIINPDATG